MRYLCFLIFIMLLTAFDPGLIHGQVNPFDLKHRLSEEERSAEDVQTTEPNSDVPIPTPDNPEDVGDSLLLTEESTIQREEPGSPGEGNIAATQDEMHASTGTSTEVDKSLVKEVKSRGVEKSRSPLFLFLMLIAATILTTLTISSNRSLVNNILRAVLNDNYLNLIYREHRKSGAFHYYILYFVFVVNAGLFLYFLLSRVVLNTDIPMLWRCVLLILVVYSVRHLFMNYLGFVYPFEKEVGQYAFTILIFNIFLGLLLLPINVFVAFSPEPIAQFFLYAGLFLILTVYIFRQLRGIFIGNRLLFNNKFYFLLYLCAVEIAPILLLVKYAGVYVS